MYNGSSGEGLSLRDIQYVHWDCRTRGAAESKRPPGSGGASVRSGVVLVMRVYIVARMANAGNPSNGHRSSSGRQMSHARVEGTDERELNTSWDMKIWKEQRKVVK